MLKKGHYYKAIFKSLKPKTIFYKNFTSIKFLGYKKVVGNQGNSIYPSNKGHLSIYRSTFCVSNLMKSNIIKMQLFDDMKVDLIIKMTTFLWTTFVLVFWDIKKSLEIRVIRFTPRLGKKVTWRILL